LIQEEIKRRFKSGNDCYHSVQNVLSFCLLPKNIKIRICKTIILPLGTPRHACRCVDNIEVYLGEIGWCGLNWIGSIQDRNKWRALVNATMNLWVP
jgi:hypothetical protein